MLDLNRAIKIRTTDTPKISKNENGDVGITKLKIFLKNSKIGLLSFTKKPSQLVYILFKCSTSAS